MTDLSGPKKMHRVGLAVVQFTRSTSAEATAGRESLQPSALRARCTRKSSRSFRECQARRERNCRKYRQLTYRGLFAPATCRSHVNSTQKCTESGAPSSGFPTDLRRSDCLSESHQPRALLPRCNQDSTARRDTRQVISNLFSRSLRLFLYKSHILASSLVCSTWAGPRIRRAGCAFVHFPG